MFKFLKTNKEEKNMQEISNNPMEYQAEIDKIATIFNMMPADIKKETTYKIDYCNVNYQEWRMAIDKSADIENFENNAYQIIKVFKPHAILVTIFYKKTEKEKIPIKLIDDYIFLIDKNTRNEQPNEQLRTSSFLSGLEQIKNSETERIKDKFENEMKIVKLEHKYELDKLQNRIENLQKEKSSLETETCEFAEEIEELEEKITSLENELSQKSKDNQKQLTTLGAVLGGKMFGLKTAETMQLAGILSGGEVDMNQLNEAMEKGGGINEEVEEEDNEKSQKINSIKMWISSLDDNVFNRFWDMMQQITRVEGAFEKAYKSVLNTESSSSVIEPTINE